MGSSPEYMFHLILSYRWPTLNRPQKLCDNANYPTPLLPIFASLLHSKILTDEPGSEQHFEATTGVIVDEFPLIPFSHSTRFLTTVLLILLIENGKVLYHFNEQKVQMFLGQIKPIMKTQLIKILQPALNRSEMLVNRFATANFNFDHLLADFRDVMKMNRDSFKFGTRINNFVMGVFLQIFEVSMINKIMSNPDRFCFSNAMMWNSFLSAFENDERLSLPNIRNYISALIMAQAISEKPEMKNDICPELDSRLVAYIIGHYKKDMNITHTLKIKPYLKKFKLKSAPSKFNPLPEPDKFEISDIAESLNLTNWCVCNKDEECVNVYSYIASYCKNE
ncbi:hypothetical protein TRFO_20944 [Tritrichomonas foetus]|uniref:Uncharacterized protein n=1 Tax=Tritrichomonas foetus TaxID=1144522 RepID=A0A1J4KKR7_9EUKA|nr:hypothetical protein TRFO_20944 [Tritrichomonas foetus]|eukprot:OHT09965.1 hypothetical protein TRFO_20944 [Tritrichomonas foetus]